ncbi:putative small nuclear ribonucleoprotein Sm D3 [Tribonema minus]|uniref:Small nuclear ribonucleoprotein Sm D3 n=1 Tax=Tribonema minus TaxID=303371 RepID=A0A835ZED0_9STRA|nr:putative small nuclear ribonucleoprotein Sm D3 [Tribonema minus]
MADGKAVGVPIKLLHEGEGHVITIEMKNGEIYRGRLMEAEDTMNSFITEVTMTARDGRVSKLEQVYLRGSHIKFIILPDLLKNAPVFKGVQKMAGAAAATKAAKGRGGGGKKKKKAA